MFFLPGASFLISEQSLPIDHPSFTYLSSLSLEGAGGGRLSLLALIMLAVVVLGILLANRTRFGNNVYAIGGNATSAALMGISVRHHHPHLPALHHVGDPGGYSVRALYLGGLSARRRRGGARCHRRRGDRRHPAERRGGHRLRLPVRSADPGLIQTYISFDGTLSSWWTKIIIGLLLFCFIALQRLLILVSEHRKANKPGPFKRQIPVTP